MVLSYTLVVEVADIGCVLDVNPIVRAIAIFYLVSILKKEISYDDAIAAPPSLTGWRSILNYLLITSTELGSAINARSVEQLKKTIPTPSPFEFRVELA